MRFEYTDDQIDNYYSGDYFDDPEEEEDLYDDDDYQVWRDEQLIRDNL